MPRGIKMFALVVLVALLPLRAVAGVTIGICPAGHEDMAVAEHATGYAHDAGSHDHPGDDLPSSSGQHSCNICAEHCSSTAFAPAEHAVVDPQPIRRDRPLVSDHLATVFITDQLDRPPLA